MLLNRDNIEKRFGKIVIWGLASPSSNTHRYRNMTYADIFTKLNIPFVWCDDSIKNSYFIEDNNLVIVTDICGNNLHFIKNAYYCMLNFDLGITVRYNIKKYLHCRIYGESGDLQKGELLDETTIFDDKNRILYQPSATDLLPDEFLEPIFPCNSDAVYWIGSIWNDSKGHGNISEIAELRHVLMDKNLKFIHVSGISKDENILRIRESRLAPAIGGTIQVKRNVLPCRMWKNISYGQFGFSNIPKFWEIFSKCTITGDTIEQLVTCALTIPESTYKEYISKQQDIVKRKHTYLNRFENILKILKELY